MGREATITYEQVAAAANELKAGGNKPSSRAVRERLGHIGSLGTITRMLADWKATQEVQPARTWTLPAPLQRAVVEFIEAELARARAGAEAELAEQRQEAADL